MKRLTNILMSTRPAKLAAQLEPNRAYGLTLTEFAGTTTTNWKARPAPGRGWLQRSVSVGAPTRRAVAAHMHMAGYRKGTLSKAFTGMALGPVLEKARAYSKGLGSARGSMVLRHRVFEKADYFVVRVKG